MLKHKYNVIRSNRKTVSFKIGVDETIIVHAPMRLAQHKIEKILLEHEAWIEKQISTVRQTNEAASGKPLSGDQIRHLANEAKDDIMKRVCHYAAIMGVTYNRITIRSQKGRWGSCSSKGNLNFNCLLMLAPEHVRDYVVVHELAHRKQMNHSAAFWIEVENVLPDYKECVLWLKKNGPILLAQMRLGE